ncbi:N-acetyltransferase family protein [Hasllibacter sp. MH4015]|uniref:GNAT family N-acetyltransferase n=1 Tax=Hasllibacter sp. MH4015 TaxID=2854029 RepID=UPI00351CDF63
MEITFRDIEVGDVEWLIRAHAERYAEDDGFDDTFGPLVAGILEDFMAHRERPVERAWIACDGDRRLGSIFCVKGALPGVAKLRLFLLLPAARGKGLGRRMLDLCIEHARAQGFAALTLWTHESHAAACALYRKAGFVCVASRPVHSFGVDLVEQEWTLDLSR